MKFTVVSLFPEQLKSLLNFGVVGQAIDQKLIQLETVNPRQFTQDRHQSVDDRPFGGGDGMVMTIEPLQKAIESIEGWQASRKILLSPQGETLTHGKVKELCVGKDMILISGRYGGLDQRFIDRYVDEEVSIGDYVLSGGELAVAVLIDAVSRQRPGVLGNVESSERESFSRVLLEEPQFTRPRESELGDVPGILFSGHHGQIEKWKQIAALLATQKKRPDLFEKWLKELSKEPANLKPLTSQLRSFMVMAPEQTHFAKADLEALEKSLTLG